METPKINSSCNFKQFDVVSDFSDHYFRDQTDGADCFTNAQSSVHRRIMKEWRILQHNLPDSIFVRVFETRIDLLRAAVIGVAGTPYHDGVFFFDIVFPNNYPTQPPKVRYLSFGYYLNPNLFDTGYVCLSLLNTVRGRSCERWIPAKSTVLQILISLQSLVLNENPYYNESLIRRTEWNQKYSIEYDYTVFVLTCKSTIQLIRKPPRNFESFVRWHFRRRANAILMACEQYANGRARIGFYGQCELGHRPITVSRKFQKAITMVYPIMVRAFQGIGATLFEGVEVLRLEETNKSEGILKRVITVIGEILLLDQCLGFLK